MTDTFEKVVMAQTTIEDKVEGVWVPEHDQDGHHYRNTQTDALVDSVTTKMVMERPRLQNWKIKKAIEWMEENERWLNLADPEVRNHYIQGAIQAPNEERDKAGDTGTLAHHVLEAYVKAWIRDGKPPEDIRKGFSNFNNPDAVAAARAGEKAFKENDIVPIASELIVGSEKHKVAGQIDKVCLFNGELCILDFKTNNHISDSIALQVSAYVKMFEEMTGLKVKKAKVLRLSKDYDKYILYDVPYINRAFKAYKGIASYYDWDKSKHKKMKKSVRSRYVK